MKTTIDRAKIQKVRQLRSEQDRLLQVLEFYGWLEEHGLSWDQIKGIRPLDNTPRSRTEFRRSCRKNREHIWEKYMHADMVEIQIGALCNYRWVVYNPEVHDESNCEMPPQRRPHAYQGRFIDILLKDGEQVILPWPPYPEDVVYNKERI